jgi:hypothetical protein
MVQHDFDGGGQAGWYSSDQETLQVRQEAWVIVKGVCLIPPEFISAASGNV